jgi:hypothetical protein
MAGVDACGIDDVVEIWVGLNSGGFPLADGTDLPERPGTPWQTATLEKLDGGARHQLQTKAGAQS